MDLSKWRDETSCKVEGAGTIPLHQVRKTSPCTKCTCQPSGLSCESDVINCNEIRVKFQLDDILRDNACRAQCGSILVPNRPPQGFVPFAGPPNPQNNQRPVNVNEGLTPPPPPPPPIPQQGPPPRPIRPVQNPIVFRPPPPRIPPENTIRFPFPIPSFLRSLFS